jgi:hypothetical protein
MNDHFDMQLRGIAGEFRYPATPDIAASLRERLAVRGARRPALRLGLAPIALLIVLLLAAALLAVPSVRAAILEWLQIGGIRIWLVEPTPTPTMEPSLPGETPPPTATPRPVIRTPYRDLAGLTTLDAAREQVYFPIRLPGYPPDLGQPDDVYLQAVGGPLVVLVWRDPADPHRARLALHILGPGVVADKGAPPVVESAAVNGQPALWTTGPYMLEYTDGMGFKWLVEGHVLLWEQDGLTHRLETGLPLDEAIRIAESLEETTDDRQ